MILAIAILSGIGYLFSIFEAAVEGRLGSNSILATILVMTTWNSCFPLAVITIVVWGILLLLALAINSK
jgi:hypothetical protein